MNKFIQKLFQLIILILFISIFSLLVIDNEYKWEENLLKLLKIEVNDRFFKKKKLFEEFIKGKKSINLILGSSHIRDGIIPDSLGDKWYSFSNSGQTIYNSYKFLNYYKDNVKVDTIIVGIEPFDFQVSFMQDNSVGTNPNFIVFGSDSIMEFVNKRNKKFYYQNLKSKLFPTLETIKENLIIKETNLLSQAEIIDETNLSSQTKWITVQGYSRYGINKIGRDEDALYNMSPQSFHTKNFNNVTKQPNMKYFQQFHSLCQKLNIDVIYLLTPKSKYYNLKIIKIYNNEWNAIKDSLKTNEITLWNYENFNQLTIKPSIFYKYNHISYEGSKVFTKIIRKRLYETSE